MTIHTSTVGFEDIVEQCQAELQGCPITVIKEAAALVLSQFCEKTHCYREEQEILLDGSDRYGLESPRDSDVVIGVQEVVVGGSELLPGDYYCDSPTSIRFVRPSAGSASIILLLKTKPNSKQAPKVILERWSDIITMGVKAYLMVKPTLPWSNEGLGSYYQARYDLELLRVSADIRNQFSVSRTGIAARHRSNSVFGV